MSGRYIRMFLKDFGIPTIDRRESQIALLKIAGAQSRFKKGVPSWSSGFTKQTHPSVAAIAASKVGKPRPDMRGDKHPLWKGGATSEAMLVRNSNAYSRWRDAVFHWDDFTCVDCGVRGGHLHAHHVMPFSTHPELRLDASNGVTLCVPCHANRHPDHPNLKNKAKSLEHRKSLSEALKIAWADPERRARQSARLKASMNDAVKKKISDAKKGQVPWNKGLTKKP